MNQHGFQLLGNIRIAGKYSTSCGVWAANQEQMSGIEVVPPYWILIVMRDLAIPRHILPTGQSTLRSHYEIRWVSYNTES